MRTDQELSELIASVPARRLGALLQGRRLEARIGVEPAARAAGIDISALDDLECGRKAPSPSVLAALLDCYGTRPHELVPKGRAIDPGSFTAAPTDEMLRNYVDLVQKWRKPSRSETVKFRHSDLRVLVTVLGTDAAEIERRLVAITGCSRGEARALRKLFLAALRVAPAAVILVGVAFAGEGPLAAAAQGRSTSGRPAAHTTGPTMRLVSQVPVTSVATVVGVLQPSLDRLATTRAAGVGSVVVSAHWSAFAPRQGAINQHYVAQLRAEIQRYAAAGMRIILGPGLGYVPSWVFGLNASTRFVDQYGNVWYGGAGENVPDPVWDPAVRQAQHTFLAELGASLSGLPISAVRAGGLLNGELRYPPATSHNSYWAFDRDAQAQSPVPGWRPGDPGKAQATAFVNWYLGSLTVYQNALVTATKQAFPAANVMVLYPAWGIRPGQIEQAVNGDLDGSSPAELNGALSEGLDWASQVASLPVGTTVYTTDLGAPDQGPGVTGEAPVFYLASLAAPRKLPLAGENAGLDTAVTLDRCVQRARQLGLTDMLWMNEASLYSARAVDPTLADLGQAAHQLGQVRGNPA